MFINLPRISAEGACDDSKTDFYLFFVRRRSSSYSAVSVVVGDFKGKEINYPKRVFISSTVFSPLFFLENMLEKFLRLLMGREKFDFLPFFVIRIIERFENEIQL